MEYISVEKGIPNVNYEISPVANGKQSGAAVTGIKQKFREWTLLFARIFTLLIPLPVM